MTTTAGKLAFTLTFLGLTLPVSATRIVGTKVVHATPQLFQTVTELGMISAPSTDSGRAAS